jgi:glucose uptake protein GlcU
MYPLALLLHSWLRWVVLILGIIAVVRAIGGRTGRPWSQADDTVSKWFGITFDIQFVIGLLLYAWLSPVTQAVFADFGGAMRNAGLRFWAVEHVAGMLVAIALVHIGRGKIRKATTDRRRHTLAALFYGIALILMLASIPWPGRAAQAPLFRGL